MANLFFSYTHKDEDLRNQLETHLAALKRQGLISAWHDRRIMAGHDFGKVIDANLDSADVILLLVSPDFIASDYCYEREMARAMERQTNGEARVIPVILRPCDWHDLPFGQLLTTPRDGKAITLWPNIDQAFLDIVTAIKAALQELGRAGKTQELRCPSASRGNSPERVIRSGNLGIRKQFTDLWEGEHPAPVSTALPSAQRTVDVAMPGRITRDRATELMVLIRLDDSAGLCGILQDDHEAEARPEDVRSRPFEITFVLGPDGRPVPLSIGVQITSPDFQPPSQMRNILVPVDRNSEVCSFLLTPLKAGMLTVIVDLTWEGTQRGSRRLRTTCVRQATNDSSMMLVQIPYRLKPANSSETSDGAAIPLSRSVPIASSPSTFSDREVKRIRRFLDLDEGDLYLLIPEHLPEYKRATFSPSGQQEAGRLAFESLLPKLYDLLCVRWEYCNHSNAAEFQSIETLIITVAGVISEVCGEIPPLLVATLLTKKGLDSFCECKLARG